MYRIYILTVVSLPSADGRLYFTANKNYDCAAIIAIIINQ